MKRFLNKNHKKILIINIIILIISSVVLISSAGNEENKITALSLINFNDYTFSMKEPVILVAFLIFILNLIVMILIIMMYRSRNIYIKTLK